MIEPLRHNKEVYSSYELERPAFCVSCLAMKHTRSNPGVAVVFCHECPSLISGTKEYGALLCRSCEEDKHRLPNCRNHTRQIVVVGPGIRKKVVVRGDAVNFPMPMDHIRVQMKARIYLNGKLVHKEPRQNLRFVAGMSGKSLHVQILGARGLQSGDLTGLSDPFVVYSYCGKPISSTRVRPRTCNPRWTNEAFMIPLDENQPYPRNMIHSQKDLIKLEVFDHDWISASELLGHIEMTRSKLMKLAVVANEQPIRIPLTMKEYHGILHFQLGLTKDHLHVRIVCGEDFDKKDLHRFNSPYVKLFMGEKALLGTTPVINNTINPIWTSGNEFRISIKTLLEAEAHLQAQIKFYKASIGLSGASATIQPRRNERRGGNSTNQAAVAVSDFTVLPDFLALFRAEVYDKRKFSKDSLMGRAVIPLDQLRAILPDLPEQLAVDPDEELSFHFGDQQQEVSLLRDPLAYMKNLLGLGPQLRARSSSDIDDSSQSDIEAPSLRSKADDQSLSMSLQDQQDQTPSGMKSSRSRRNSADNNSAAHSKSTINRLGFGKVIRRKKKEEVRWSNVFRFRITRQSKKDTVGDQSIYGGAENRGFLIVRLLISNRGQVITGLDHAVQQMTIGETSIVKCRYDLAYGSYGLSSTIPPRSNVVFTIRLMDINGYGSLGAPIRQMRRLFRIVLAICKAVVQVFAVLFGCRKEPEVAQQKSSKKKKRRGRRGAITNFLITLGLQAHHAESSSEDSLSSGSDSDSDEDNFDHEEEDEPEEDEEEWRKEQERLKFGKVDPRMKKHLTPSVRAGGKLLWGDNFIKKPPLHPPPPPPHRPAVASMTEAEYEEKEHEDLHNES